MSIALDTYAEMQSMGYEEDNDDLAKLLDQIPEDMKMSDIKASLSSNDNWDKEELNMTIKDWVWKMGKWGIISFPSGHELTHEGGPHSVDWLRKNIVEHSMKVIN